MPPAWRMMPPGPDTTPASPSGTFAPVTINGPPAVVASEAVVT